MGEIDKARSRGAATPEDFEARPGDRLSAIADVTSGTWRWCGGLGVINWGDTLGFRVVYSWQRIA